MLTISKDDKPLILLGSGPHNPKETSVRTFRVGILKSVVKNESIEKFFGRSC
jgi:hypothetical protein